MDGMERMLANSIIHLTMHRIHDEREDCSQQMRHTWEQREEMGRRHLHEEVIFSAR